MSRVILNSIRRSIHLLLLVGAITSAVPTVFAAELTEVQRKLAALKKELSKEEERGRTLAREEKRLTGESEKLNSQMRELGTKEAQLRKEIAKLDSQLPIIEAELSVLKQELTKRQHGLDDRLVAMYKFSRKRSALSLLAESTSTVHAAARARYISAISSSDWKAVTEVTKEADSVKQEEEFLSTAKAQQLAKVSELKKLGEETEKKRFQVASLLREVSVKKEEQERVLERLKRSAQELELLLASIMGREESAPERADRVGPAPKENTTGFEGQGLSPGQGIAPVKGAIVQRFGNQRLEEFSDMVFSKGLEFSGSVGARVTPIAPGKVILSQVLPGLGNVVILDHGKRYYTLYGRLASVLCQVGSVLGAKDVIGLLGEQDFKGRNLYFELRHKGQAVDPGKFLGGKKGGRR